MASTLIAASLTIGLAGPAYHPEPCVSYADICVPGYVVKYFPTRPPEIGSRAVYVALIEKYWDPDLVAWAVKIVDCETGGTWDPKAKNPYSTAAGLFQFLRSTWDLGPAKALGLPSYDSGAVYNPEWNIQAAAWLYANWGGTSQWACKSGL